MKRVSLKAVFIGSVVSFAMMLVFIIILGRLYAMLYAGAGTQEEIAAAFANSAFSWPALAGVVIGGYVAARIAGTAERLHGALSSSLNVLWGLFCILVLGQTQPAAIIIMLLNPILGLLGGYIRQISLHDWS